MEDGKITLDLSCEEVRLICELLSGRIASEYFLLYHSPISSTDFCLSEEVQSMCLLRKRLGSFIGVNYV